MKSLKITWRGIRPLLMNNGLLVDPRNPFVRAMKEITRKGSKKMTDADYEMRDRLEWEGSLYWDDKLGPVLPSALIEAVIRDGAKKSRQGKDVLAAVLVEEDLIPLEYEGPRDKDALWKNERFQLRARVVMQKAAVIRVRPMFPTGWRATFTVAFDETIISETDLRKAMINGGALCGGGNWRPKFGRFVLED